MLLLYTISSDIIDVQCTMYNIYHTMLRRTYINSTPFSI